jgi:GYF domain 2
MRDRNLESEFWFIDHAGDQLGPISKGVVVKLIKNGTIGRNSLIWTAGMEGWQMAGSVDLIAVLFVESPPPLPAQPSVELGVGNRNGSRLAMFAAVSVVVILMAFFFLFGGTGPGNSQVKAALQERWGRMATVNSVSGAGCDRPENPGVSIFKCHFKAEITFHPGSWANLGKQDKIEKDETYRIATFSGDFNGGNIGWLADN